MLVPGVEGMAKSDPVFHSNVMRWPASFQTVLDPRPLST